MAVDTVTLTAANNWSHTFEALPTADKNGQAYTYMVSETAVPGYTTQITGDAQTGFTITNTKADRYTSLTVEKIWTLDNGGKAAASVQVELLRDGQRYEIVELNEKNGWSYTWEQLNDKYDWSVAEVDIPGRLYLHGFTPREPMDISPTTMSLAPKIRQSQTQNRRRLSLHTGGLQTAVCFFEDLRLPWAARGF